MTNCSSGPGQQDKPNCETINIQNNRSLQVSDDAGIFMRAAGSLAFFIPNTADQELS